VTEGTEPESIDQLIGLIDQAHARVVTSAAALSDAQARQPSLLPGWSRGHVLTHIARNADGLRNLLIWAETGRQTAQYPSYEVRNAQIEEGSGRSAADLTDDLASSGAAFVRQARRLGEVAWGAEVRRIRGPAHPAWRTLPRRLFEVEVHHVDLSAGYLPSDWADWFVSRNLAQITEGVAAGSDPPGAVLIDAVTGDEYDLRPDSGSKVSVTGHGDELLAWLLGRSSGDALSADPAGPLPEVPPFESEPPEPG